MKDMSKMRATLICEAIRERRVLEFEYQGKPRVVEPYTHGLSTRGAEVMRAIQIGGESRSGGFRFGKLWYVDEMKNVRLSEKHFEPSDPNYNPNDTGMKAIHCRIEKTV